ncbi:MAG: aldo/keto reductase, partial [Rhodanobacter sp.]
PKGVRAIAAWVGDQMQASLRRLKVDSIYGLLLHRSENLLGAAGRSMVQALERLKAEGVVQKIGVSIYAPQELDAATQACAIDLVQAPLNLVDRRLVTSGWLQRLHDQGVEVHARSAFLQGLLLLPRDAVPAKFSPWSDLFDNWHVWLKEKHVTAAEACLAFVAPQPLIDRVVVGVDSCAQLRELLRAASKEPPQHLPDLRCNDERLINPSNWNSL